MRLPRHGRMVSRNKETVEKSRDCVEKIKAHHRNAILSQASPREAGLEDAVLSEATLQSICDNAHRFSDSIEYAAFAMEYIAVFHPFIEGNKRTALAVAVCILNNNGYTLPDSDFVYRYILEVAEGRHTRDEIADWIRANAVRSQRASQRRSEAV